MLKPVGAALAVLVSGILCITPVFADLLSELPSAWRDRLQPVTQPDLLKLTDEEKQRAVAVRKQLSAKLAQNSSESSELAALYGELGKIYQFLHVDTHAQHCYENAHRLDPNEFRWVYYQAWLAHDSGDLHTAMQRYQQAARLNPDYLPLQYRLADIYLNLNQLEKSAAILNELRQHEEFSAEVNSGLGQIALLQQDYDKAIKYLSLALEQQPEALSLHYTLAQAYRGKGDRERAREHFTHYQNVLVKAYDPLVQELDATLSPKLLAFVHAMEAVRQKDYTTAIKHFKTGLESFPDNASARTSYARALYLNGDSAEARKQLELSLQQKPDKVITLFLLALLDDAEGRKQQAVERYKKVIALKPNHDGAHFFLGNHYLRSKDYHNAVKHYDAVIETGSNNKLAVVFRLSAKLANTTSIQTAAELIAEANRDAGGVYPLIRLQIIVLALSDDEKVRDLKTARTLVEELVEKQPSPRNIELLALVNAADGRFEEANEKIRQVNMMLSQMPYGQDKKFQSRYTRLFMEQRLPSLDLVNETRRLVPKPTDPKSAFRDYPDPRPIL